MNQIVLSLDIGGTWIKGATYSCEELSNAYFHHTLPQPLNMVKRESCLAAPFTIHDFQSALNELIKDLLSIRGELCSIAISTAGVVDYAGKRIKFVAPHLSSLKNIAWVEWLKNEFDVPVTLINDANATMLGAAPLGYLNGLKTIGVMPIGTGLGFSVWRNGRVWTPDFSYTLLGCIETPDGNFDQWASIVGLAKRYPDIALEDLFKMDKYKVCLKSYLEGLVKIVQTAYYMYHTNEVLIGGGLADLVIHVGFPLEDILNNLLKDHPLADGTIPSIRLLDEGNRLPLAGAAMLGYGEHIAQKSRWIKPYSAISTENAYDASLHLEKMTHDEFVRLLWKAEQEAGVWLEDSLSDLSLVIGRVVERLKSGGRLLYVGAGTSGRLAAIDTVEIACTFGFPRDKVLTFIAGGVADASIEIECDFEEDASSVPEMLAASLGKNDVVVGISVSGSAYYVQSALAFAKGIGAYSVLIQEEDVKDLPFCDKIISLRTGYEIVAGSTRMKAGTATKKILNFLSTATMVSLGNVYGCYMTHLECINEKLICRALHILQTLFGLTNDDSFTLLEKNRFDLNRTINFILKDNQYHE